MWSFTRPVGAARAALAIVGSSIVLAGCSPGGSGSSVPAALQPAALTPSTGVLSAARAVGPDGTDGTAGSVLLSLPPTSLAIYSPAGKLEKTIGGFVASGALAAGAAGGLYDVDINESKILLYASNYRTVTATLDDPGEYPVGVAYDAKTGVVGVTNIISTNDGSGSVSFYAKNATKPCVTLRKNHVASVYFAAFDATGNLYVNGKTDTGQVFIGVVSGECAATSITALSTKKPLGFPGGVQVAPDGNIAIGDQLSSTIDTYKPPVNGHLGVPITTTSLTDGGIAFVFSKSGKTLWAQGSSSVVEYAYPAGGAPLVTIGVEAAGIVVLPVAPPG